MTRIFLIICLYSGFIFQSVMAEDNFPGVTKRQQISPLNQNNGESIDVMRGEISYETIDAIIPGNNGMDIVIARTYRKNDVVWGGMMGYWELEVPRITIATTPWGITRGWQPSQFDDAIKVEASTRTGICNDPYPGFGRSSQLDSEGGTAAGRYWGGIELKIPGQPVQYLLKNTDTTGRYPAGTKWVTTSDWIVSCGSNYFSPTHRGGAGFIVQSPEGITYTFDQLKANADVNGVMQGWAQGHNILYATRVENIHGNSINYLYEQTGGFFEHRNASGRLLTKYLLPGMNPKLIQITRNDGQVVDFSYKNIHGDEQNYIQKISFNSQEYSYIYDEKFYLKIVDRPDNSYWQYTYNGEKIFREEKPGIEPSYFGHNRLTQVKNPAGGTIDYRYKVSNKLTHDPFNENMRLYTKTVNDGTENIYTWTFDYLNDGSNVKVIIDKGSETSTQIYKNDKSFQHGRLMQKTISGVNESGSLIKQDTKYTYKEIAEIGSFDFDDYPENLPKSITTKVALTKQTITQDSNSFVTEYQAHDLYGRPTKTIESHAGKTKYTKLAYHDEKGGNWILGLPTTVEVSDVDSNYVTVSETTYHNASTAGGSYAGLGLPYEQKQYGRLVKRFTEFNSGQLAEVELNVARTAGTGNRFIQYSNYKRGVPQTITTPSRYTSGNITQSRIVDDYGNLTSETDLNGTITGYAYDELGRLSAIDLANDTSYGNWLDTLITWSGNTRTTQRCTINLARNACIDTAQLTTTEVYDGLLRLKSVQTTDGNGGTNSTRYQNFTYDHNNQNTFTSFVSDYASETKGTDTVYDALQRVSSRTTTGRGKVEYRYLSNNGIARTDAKGQLTNTYYEAYGTPSYHQPGRIVSVIDSNTGETTTTAMDVDVLGQINTVTQSGLNGAVQISQTETNIYNAKQQLCLKIRTDVGATAYGYNDLGEMSWQAQGVSYNTSNPTCIAKPAGIAITYTLDNLGDIKKVDYPDTASSDVIYVRDNNGNVKSLTAGTIRHNYNYNNQNLLENETLTIGSEKSFLVNYSYNNMLFLRSTTYPDNNQVYYQPNGYGEATQVTSYSNFASKLVDYDYASNAKYFTNGMLNSFSYGNGITHTTHRNSVSWLPKQLLDVTANSQNIIDLNYTYDNNLNVISILNSVEPTFDITNLTYDGLDRLKSTTGEGASGNSTVSYDGLGNIRTYSNDSLIKPSRLVYDYDANTFRLTKVTDNSNNDEVIRDFSKSSSYDKRGNVLSNGNGEGLNNFSYNLANQMMSAGTTNTYSYDGNNRRVKSTKTGGKVSYSMYSQSGKLLYRETEQGGINYYFLGNKLVAKEGSGIIAPKVAKNETSISHFKPFGDIIEIPEQVSGYANNRDDVGYTGHKFDTDLGLSYMQARYYDPVIGRFYSNDPLGFRDVHSFNRYAYANNNPYRYTDPTGMSSAEFAPIPGITHKQNTIILGNAAVDAGKELAIAAVGGAVINGAVKAVQAVRAISAAGNLAKTANAANASGKTSGAAAELTVEGQSFTAVSGGTEALAPEVTATLMSTPKAARAPWHGGCAEVSCVSSAIKAGVNPQGGNIKAVNIGGASHGTPKALCSSCQHLIKQFGITNK